MYNYQGTIEIEKLDFFFIDRFTRNARLNQEYFVMLVDGTTSFSNILMSCHKRHIEHYPAYCLIYFYDGEQK